MTTSEPVTLTNCDREPIHIPGSIQPHGAMLVCDPGLFQLLHASQNTAKILGISGPVQAGMPVADLIGEKLVHDVRNALAKAAAPGQASILLGVKLEGSQVLSDIKVHGYLGRGFIEIEPRSTGNSGNYDALDLTHQLVRRISSETSVEGIARTGARLVRAMLGYDRVMIYQFLHNGAGRVIAEAKSSRLGSFMGQHFPASDIPYQARRLYLINSVRMISDVAYRPIPMEPALTEGEAAIDMSFAQLRSVSPIHCEYLQNMGVAASLSISIIVEGELWGLISCHHDSPKTTPMALRVGAELLGHYFSMQIALAERRNALVASQQARAELDRLVGSLASDGHVMEELSGRLGQFASLVHCDGAALWMNGVWEAFGPAIDREMARAVVDLAEAQVPRGIWTTQEIGVHHAGDSGDVAGVMAIPISVTLGDYLILFRREEAHDVVWAGEPKKGMAVVGGTSRLTPRGSFETWREDVRGRSLPWTEADRNVAEAIRSYLRDIVLRQSEISAEERARTDQRRRILNDELNHRVKNILSLVRSIALQTGAKTSSVEEYSASLEGRLRALAFAHDQSLGGRHGGDLAGLIEVEAGLHQTQNAPERVSLEGPALALDDRAFGVLALVVHEMMTNAAKYGALSIPAGRLRVEWRLLENGDCLLDWRELDGPAVAHSGRDGFGTKLIRSTIEYDLRGKAELDYAVTGVRARFTIPAAHLRRQNAPIIPAKAPPPVAGTLSGCSVLVVEDQGLIAMDAEETLRRLGATDVQLSPTVEDAIAKLAKARPDLAVLDFNLGSGTSEPVADWLLAHGVPFVFTTGYSDSVMIPQRFREVPVVRKPIDGPSLALHLRDAVRPAGEQAQRRRETD